MNNRFKLVVVTTAFASCTGEAAPGGASSWRGEVIDSAGIQLVRNPVEGIWSESSAWRTQHELSIDVATSGPEAEFGDVTDVAVDSLGRIFVLDGFANQFTAFDPDGKFLFAGGGLGEGPGEFAGGGPFRILVAAGDSIVIPDGFLGRANLFTPEGRFVRSFPLETQDLAPRQWMVGPQGSVFARRLFDSQDLIVRLDLEGRQLESLVTLEYPQRLPSRDDPTSPALTPVPVWATLPTGEVVHGHSHAYRLTASAPSGAIRLIVTRPLTARALSDAERLAFRDRLREVLKNRGAPPTAVDQAMRLISGPEREPLIIKILAGPEETIWVQRAQTIDVMDLTGLNLFRADGLGSERWDVFSGDGRFLGQVQLPDRFDLRRIRGDQLFGVQRDAFDVPAVVRLRILRN
jgi:hypothetical protein